MTDSPASSEPRPGVLDRGIAFPLHRSHEPDDATFPRTNLEIHMNNLLLSLWTHGRAKESGKKRTIEQQENFLSISLAAVLSRDPEALAEFMGLYGLEDVRAARVDLQVTLRDEKGQYIGQPDIVIETEGEDGSERFVVEVKWGMEPHLPQLEKYGRGQRVRDVWLLSCKRLEGFDKSRTWGEVMQILRRVSLRSGGRGGLRDELVEVLANRRFGARMPNPLAALDRAGLAASGDVIANAAAVVRRATEAQVAPLVSGKKAVEASADDVLDFSVELRRKDRRGPVRALGLEVELSDSGSGLDWCLWVCFAKKKARKFKKKLKRAGWSSGGSDGDGGRWFWTLVHHEQRKDQPLVASASAALERAKLILRTFKQTASVGSLVAGELEGDGGPTVGRLVHALNAQSLSLAIVEGVLLEWRDSACEALGTESWSAHFGSKEGVYLKSNGLGTHYRCYFSVMATSAEEGIPSELVGRLCWRFSLYAQRQWSPDDAAEAVAECGWSRVSPSEEHALYLARPVDGEGPIHASRDLWAALRGWLEG